MSIDKNYFSWSYFYIKITNIFEREVLNIKCLDHSVRRDHRVYVPWVCDIDYHWNTISFQYVSYPTHSLDYLTEYNDSMHRLIKM